MEPTISLDMDGIRVQAGHYAARAVQHPHEHAEGTMTLVFRGELLERVGDREERAGALSVVVKPPGVRHANRFGPDGASTLQVAFEPHVLSAWGGEWRMGGWRWIHGGAVARPFVALLAALRRAERVHDDDPESLIYDLCASVAQDNPRASSSGAPPRWLARTRTRLLEDAAEPLRVRDLAREAGVHPVSLARAFRRHYGAPIGTVLRRRRVALAASRLEGGEEPLCEVALGAGFADQPHLCRVFKATTGVTPLGFRRLARG
jgi:AraC family transcriptional regulator